MFRHDEHRHRHCFNTVTAVTVTPPPAPSPPSLTPTPSRTPSPTPTRYIVSDAVTNNRHLHVTPATPSPTLVYRHDAVTDIDTSPIPSQTRYIVNDAVTNTVMSSRMLSLTPSPARRVIDKVIVIDTSIPSRRRHRHVISSVMPSRTTVTWTSRRQHCHRYPHLYTVTMPSLTSTRHGYRHRHVISSMMSSPTRLCRPGCCH